MKAKQDDFATAVITLWLFGTFYIVWPVEVYNTVSQIGTSVSQVSLFTCNKDI